MLGPHNGFSSVQWLPVAVRTPQFHPQVISRGPEVNRCSYCCLGDFSAGPQCKWVFFFLCSPSILSDQLSFSSFSPFSPPTGRQHFLPKLWFRLLFGFKTLHCFDPPLTFDLICDPRQTPWRLWERRSVGWHVVRTTPSMLTSPSLPVRKLIYLRWGFFEFVIFVSCPAAEHVSERMKCLFTHLSYVHLLTTGTHFKLNGRAEYIWQRGLVVVVFNIVLNPPSFNGSTPTDNVLGMKHSVFYKHQTPALIGSSLNSLLWTAIWEQIIAFVLTWVLQYYFRVYLSFIMISFKTLANWSNSPTAAIRMTQRRFGRLRFFYFNPQPYLLWSNLWRYWWAACAWRRANTTLDQLTYGRAAGRSWKHWVIRRDPLAATLSIM